MSTEKAWTVTMRRAATRDKVPLAERKKTPFSSSLEESFAEAIRSAGFWRKRAAHARAVLADAEAQLKKALDDYEEADEKVTSLGAERVELWKRTEDLEAGSKALTQKLLAVRAELDRLTKGSTLSMGGVVSRLKELVLAIPDETGNTGQDAIAWALKPKGSSPDVNGPLRLDGAPDPAVSVPT